MKIIKIISFTIFIFISVMVNAQTINEVQMFRSSDYYTNDLFGCSVGLDDNFAIIGAWDEDEDQDGINPVLGSGSAYFFKKNDNVWSQYQKIKSPDRRIDDNFGWSVAISGDFAVVGARRNDFNSAFADSIAEAGAIYIFFNNNGNWEFFQKITSTTRTQNEYFGSEVQISGNYLFVGSKYHKYDANELNAINGTGAVLVYKFNGTQWIFHQKVLAPVRILNSYFGANFQYADSILFVGAPDDKTNEVNSGTITSAGSAYIFKHNGTTDQFDFVQKIIAPDRAEYDRFGGSVSGNQEFIIVSASYEDEDQNGENTLNNSGSVYVFENIDNNWVFFQKFVAPDRRADDEFGRNVEFEGNNIYVSVPYNDYDENNSNYISSSGALYSFSLNQALSAFDFSQKFVTSDRGFAAYFSVGFCIQNNAILAGASNQNKVYYLYANNIIYTNPQNTTVCEGDTTFFKITAQNFDNLQWQIQNGVSWNDLNDNLVYSGTQTDSLVVVSSNSLNQNNYRCKVSKQSVDKYTDFATLTVDTFIISVAGENQVICNNDNVALNANNPEPNTGFWFSDNSSIIFDDNTLFNTTAHNFSGTVDMLYWVINNGVCGADSSFVVITFDNINPTIACIENQVINLNEGETTYTVQGTEFDPTSTNDNCGVASVTNNINSNATLSGAEFPIGVSSITWTVTDNAGNTADCSFDVTVNAFVGISDLYANRIPIYPNPTTGKFIIKNEELRIENLVITDISGKILQSFSNFQIIEFSNYQIDISHFQNGIYFLKIETEKGVFVEKIIKN